MEQGSRTEAFRKEGEKKLGEGPQISKMEAVTVEAYGGGLYGRDDREEGHQEQLKKKAPASDTQSADGPVERTRLPLNHHSPPSTGDRDLDITGQSYIQ
ncbi:uncharacterized protein LOC114740548 [Neltuma alba]|uniref:uncharacterized protein LOC114740548 n=1 Tax=Neltuma alba TaxID=207710 RepID=UPI0010A554A8|nr:uncharacterized protein LOC114740548 [Prosopis alba]